MRILLGVHQFFPHHYTGTERYVLNLARQLQKMGHFVTVLTYGITDQNDFLKRRSSKMLLKEYLFEGVPVISLRHTKILDNHSFVFDLIDMDFYHEVMNIFKKKNFDIYHCAHPFRIASSISAAKDAGIKVVFMATDYWMMCPIGIMLRLDNTLCEGPAEGNNCLKYCFTKLAKESMMKRITNAHKIIDSCDCLLSPSRFLIGLFDHTGFIPASRFILSRHGYDYKDRKRKEHIFNEPKEIITFGYIGTIQYHKGVHVMVEGFKKVNNKNIRLQVWGGCFHEVEYQKSVMKIAEGDPRITFKGYYDFDTLHTVLDSIDVVIVPSIWYENAPLTITSSLAHQIPVITSDLGGMSEAVKDGKNGLTFRVGDSNDFSSKVMFIVNNPDFITTLKRTIEYPIRIEEEAFNTELIYKHLLS